MLRIAPRSCNKYFDPCAICFEQRVSFLDIAPFADGSEPLMHSRSAPQHITIYISTVTKD